MRPTTQQEVDIRLRVLFCELELSDEIANAREELKDYLEERGYRTVTNYKIHDGTKFDLLADNGEHKIAVEIGRHAVRYKALNQLKKAKNYTKVLLLRGNARVDLDVREGINVISVMSKGSL